MRLAKNSSVFVKVAMVLMLVLSVLISGCTGDDGKEWKKTQMQFTFSYSSFIDMYNKRETEQVSKPVSQWDEFQKDTFYLSREKLIKIIEIFDKLEKMAKNNEERQKYISKYKVELERSKEIVLSKGKYSRIVPKEHLNFDKNVKVPAVENKNEVNKNNSEKSTEIKKNAIKDNSQSKDDSKPKQTSAIEKKDVDGKGTVGVITGTEVRFRQDGNLNGKILGYFDKGEKVTVLAKENGWCKVQRENGTVGYVSSDFCK